MSSGQKNEWIVELVAARNIATAEKKTEDRKREIVKQKEAMAQKKLKK